MIIAFISSALVTFFLVRYASNNLILVRVDGTSMFPALHDGDYFLAKKRIKNFTLGRIYVFENPLPDIGEYYVIKRLDSFDEDVEKEEEYKLNFIGDNFENSLDSREYGSVAQEKVLAEYVMLLRRKHERNNGHKSKS